MTVTCVNDPPVADDETITAACNLEHVVETAPGESAAATSPIFRTVADNVLVGDSDPVEGTAVSIVQADGLTSDTTAPFDITTNEGGTVTLHADGSFTYTPEGGDRSVADSFTYTIQDADGGQDTATVNLNVGAICAWFVDNSNNGGADDTGTGTSSDPFTSLVDEIGPDADLDDAEDASQAGDVIYVFEGNSTTGDPYQGDFLADANQKLLGQGVDLVVDFGSGPENLFTGNPANRPLIDDTDGDAVQVTDVTGVEVAGFQLQADDNVLQVTSTAAAVGVHFHDNEVLGSGAEAIDLNPGSTGAFTATIEDNVFATSSATGNAIDVTTGAGNTAAVEVAISGNTDITSSAGTGINLNGTLGTGTLFVTGFADNSVHGNSGGAGVMATDVTFDADPADADFDEVAAGTWSIGESGNAVATSGMYLGTAAMEVEGHLSFTQLDIYAGNGTGLDVAGSGLFTGASGFQLTVAGGTIEATGGPAVDIDPATVGLTFSSITSTGSPTTGVSLVDVAGTFSAGAGSAIAGAVGTSFNVSGGTPAVTYGGTITHGSNGSRAVEIQSMTGGSASFGGAVSATDGTGIRIANNTGTNPVSFTSTVDLGTSGSRISDGTAFNMTGNSAGTSVTAPDVDVFTSGQTAVNASGSGLLDLDALSISTVANGRALDLAGIRSLVDVDTVTCSHSSNCVDLTTLAAASTTTFADADLTCTGGTCFNASSARTVEVTGAGNTISATGGVGLNLTSTTIGANDVTWESISASGAANGIVLDTTGTSGGLVVTGDGSNANNASGGTIASTSDHGIVATDTQDLSLTSIRIQDPGDAASEHGILATGLRGTSLLRASTITGFDQASGDGLRVVNNNVNLTELRVNNSTFSASDGNDGLAVFAQGSSNLTVIVENQSLFTDLEGDAIDVIAGDLAGSTATVSLTIADNDFTNAGATGNGGIQARTGNDGNLTGSITNNTFNDTHRLASTAGVIEIQGNNTGSLNLTVSGNDLDTFNQSGINVVADDASDVTAVISGNFIDTNQNDKIGIRSSIRNTGATRLTIQNNQIGQTTALPGTAGTRSAIDIEVFDDTGATDDVRILIDNNQLRVNKTSGTSEVLDFFIDTNADAHLTVTNNTFTNVGLGDGAEIVTDTAGTTLCLDLRSNAAVNPGPTTGDIELVELAGTYSVEALASVVANNPGANIVFDPNQAAFTNAASCLTP